MEKKFSAELGLSTVSFKMPKSKISVGTQDVEYKDTTERPIRVSMKLNTGEDLTGKGPSVVLRKGDTVVETAQEGETVTVTAAGFSGDTRAYHYVFDHWEIEGQELSETDKKMNLCRSRCRVMNYLLLRCIKRAEFLLRWEFRERMEPAFS